jgi:peroxiredoxin
MAALFSVDLLLLHLNRRLQTRVDRLSAEQRPRVGMTVPEIRGLDLDGKAFSIGYHRDSRKTLLFVFSTDCPMCTNNWPQWQRLRKSVDDQRYRVVYANVSSAIDPEYVAKYQLTGATLFAHVDPAVSLDYMMGLVPSLYLVNRDARVEKVWFGMLDDSEREEVEQALITNLRAGM